MNLLETLANVARWSSPEEFHARYPGPYLVRRRTEGELPAPPRQDALRRTLSGGGIPAVDSPTVPNPTTTELLSIPTPSGGSPLVRRPPRQHVWDRYIAYEVRKTDKNFFAQGITIGRTPNNDIHLSIPEISKFHAWIAYEGGQYRLCDAHSSNGSMLDGVRLSPKDERGAPLAPGAEISLGGIIFSFFDGKLMHQWLASQRSRAGDTLTGKP